MEDSIVIAIHYTLCISLYVAGVFFAIKHDMLMLEYNKIVRKYNRLNKSSK